MIIGIGTDIVQIKRIALTRKRYGLKFVRRILTPTEQTRLETLSLSQQDAYLAKRYAAKEALVKALGCGIGHLATWQEIEILNNEKGAPVLTLSGQTANTLYTKFPQAQIHISIADDLNAMAFVIIEDCSNHNK